MGVDQTPASGMRSICLVLSCVAFACAAAPKAQENAWNEVVSDDKWNEMSVSDRKYKLSITLSNSRYSDTTNEIFVGLQGADGTEFEEASIGKNWGKSQMGKTIVKTIKIPDVGRPAKLQLRSAGTNGVRFESIDVSFDGDSVKFNTKICKDKKCRYPKTLTKKAVAVFSAEPAAPKPAAPKPAAPKPAAPKPAAPKPAAPKPAAPKPAAPAESGVEYQFVVTLQDKRNSASNDKTVMVYAAIKGAKRNGKVPVTEYVPLTEKQGFWTKDRQGKSFNLTLNLRDVGPATSLLLKSDSGDAITFQSITVAAPGMDATYFNTDKKSVKCKSNAWFKSNNANCISDYPVGAKPGEEGQVVCVERTPATPITSNFKKPESSQDLVYGTDRFNFTVMVDCSHRGAYRFEYHARGDCGKLERRSGFSLDPDVNKECQQTNGKAYPTYEPSGELAVRSDCDSTGKKCKYPKSAISFDRGHLVPANHMDSDKTAIYESNYMTNILPQASNMNRGAWLQSEELIECFREQEDLFVLGGAVYDESYDRYTWFKESHNVDNPSFFWKIIKKETGSMLALWMPNSEDAVRARLDSYVVSIAELETNLAKFGQAQKFDIPAAAKKIKPAKAWVSPRGCDKQL